MAKILVSVFMVLLLVFSFIIYIRIQTQLELSERVGEVSDPRIELEDVQMLRYKDDRIVESLSARLGHFIEPNLVQLFANVEGSRLKGKESESMKSESATIYLDSNSMVELMRKKDAKIESAVIEDNVRFHVNDEILITEKAEHDAKNGIMFSDQPVRVVGSNRSFTGDSGFKYNLNSGEIEVYGPVRGVVKSSE